MSHNYTELLKIAYEIEGLLSLQSQRGGNAVEAVNDLLAEKIAILAEAFPAASADNAADRADDCPVAAAPATEAQVTAETPAVPDTPAPAADTADEATAASALAEEEMMAEQPVPDTPRPVAVNETIDTPLSLEEKLARERARDIFRAFTLNDKFRFRRELFRNSQEEFDEALNIISQMSTISEAEEYIYNDLCWDPENEDVKAFMDVVIKHF